MDINQLIKNQEKKKGYKEELFKKILKQAHRRIEFCSNSGDSFAIFTIPMYIPGYPLFDKSECSYYLIRELQENGFETTGYSDQYLFISWGHAIEKYNQEKLISRYLLEQQNSNPQSNPDENETKIQRTNSLIFNNSAFSLLK
jgi:hypothetical protein